MLRDIVWLVIGIGVGVLSMTLLGRETPIHQYGAADVSDEQDSAAGTSGDASTGTTSARAKRSSPPSTVGAGGSSSDTAEEAGHGTLRSNDVDIGSSESVSDGHADDAVVSGLPQDYAKLLGQSHGRRRMTPAENEEFFSVDTRDEQWAYTMELGLQEYFASNLSGEGMAIEYIDCRSRMCRIVGVVYPGYDDNLDVHLDAMRQSGWWQLSESQRTVGAGNADGVYRFISYIPRNNDDTLIADAVGCD